GVGGVAQERDGADAPVGRGWAVDDVVADDGGRGRATDEVARRIEPVVVVGQELGLDVGVLAVAWSVAGCPPVDTPGADAGDTHALAASPDFSSAALGPLFVGVFEDPSPAGVPGVSSGFITQQGPPNSRVDAVGADEGVRGLGAAVAEGQDDLRAVLMDGG